MVKRHIERIRKDSAGHLLYYFLEDTGYLKKLASYGNERDERIAMNISKFFNKLKQFESENEDSSIPKKQKTSTTNIRAKVPLLSFF